MSRAIINVKDGGLSKIGIMLCIIANVFWAYNIFGRSPYLYAFIIAVFLFGLEFIALRTLCTRKYTLLSFAFFFWLVISGLWAISGFYYNNVLRQVIPTMLLFVLAATKKYNYNTVRNIVVVLCITSVIFCAVTIRDGNLSSYYSRLVYVHNGQEYNVSYFGYFIVPSLVFLVDIIFKKNKVIFKALAIIGSMVIIAFLIMSGLRTTIMAAICTMTVFFLSDLFFENGKIKSLIYIALGIAVLYFFIDFILQLLPRELYNSLFLRSTEASFIERVELWKMFFTGLKEKSILELLVGCGFGCTAAKYGKSMHNMWFEIFDCLGIIGFILFLSLYILLIKQVISKKDRIGAALLVNDFIHGLTLSGQDSRFYWVGMTVVCLYLFCTVDSKSLQTIKSPETERNINALIRS